MPALRKRTRTVESPPTPTPTTPQPQTQIQPAGTENHDQLQTHKISVYEQSREQRIRENRERMQKLGIIDLSLNLRSHSHAPPSRRTRTRFNPKTPPTLNPSAPLRRSSRLQSVTPVSYSEVPLKKAEYLGNGHAVIEAGSKPEVYTEEHENLLGNTERSWTLFVDGCGKDGRRIYDPIKGKTCHQCRQKTLGYRTHCSKCNMVQGQFCGDCLYMRYGEHVLEALENPTWICPVCRGICNCSLCRQAKGLAPTGPLYRKISALGYKSVAHYLIQTQRSDIHLEKNDDASNPVSAKGSNKSLEVDENHVGSLNHQADSNGDQVSAKRSLLFSDVQDKLERVECLGIIRPLAGSDGGEVSTKRSLLFSDAQDQLEKVECLGTMKPLDSSSKPCSDSIAGRLRPRLKRT